MSKIVNNLKANVFAERISTFITPKQSFIENVFRNSNKQPNGLYKGWAATYRCLRTFLSHPCPKSVNTLLTCLDAGVIQTMKDLLVG